MSAAMSEHGEQLKREMGDAAGTAREQIVELRDTTRDRIEQEIERRRGELGTGARRIADATRQTGRELRVEGKELPAMLIEGAATGLDRAASYLEQTDADQLWRDVRDTGRRMPWLFVAAGAVMGFAAARMIKAAGETDTWSGHRPASTKTTDATAGATGVPPVSTMNPGGEVTSFPEAPTAEGATSPAGRSGLTSS